jgi:hypothetical protein
MRLCLGGHCAEMSELLMAATDSGLTRGTIDALYGSRPDVPIGSDFAQLRPMELTRALIAKGQKRAIFGLMHRTKSLVPVALEMLCRQALRQHVPPLIARQGPFEADIAWVEGICCVASAEIVTDG